MNKSKTVIFIQFDYLLCAQETLASQVAPEKENFETVRRIVSLMSENASKAKDRITSQIGARISS